MAAVHEGREVLPGVFLDDYGCLRICPDCGLAHLGEEVTREHAEVWVRAVLITVREMGFVLPQDFDEERGIEEWLRKEGL